jgi:hypothetical protein
MKQEKGLSESEQWIWCHVKPGNGFVGFKPFVPISSTKELSNPITWRMNIRVINAEK